MGGGSGLGLPVRSLEGVLAEWVCRGKRASFPRCVFRPCTFLHGSVLLGRTVLAATSARVLPALASLTDLPRGARTAPVTGLSAGRGAEGTTRALERFRTIQIKLCLARVFRTCASSGGPVTSRGKPGLRQRECKEGMTRGRPDGQEKEPSPHGPAPLPPPAPVNLRLGQRQPQPRAGASSARSGRGSAPLRTPP